MQQYSFIHHGARVRWNDPAADDFGKEAKDHLARIYIVYSINGKTKGLVTDDDDIILIYEKGSGTQAEVYPYELEPVKEDPDKRISRYVRNADVFLLSCIKYADRRAKNAENEASRLREQMRRLETVKKSDKETFIKDQAYSQLRAETEGLSEENAQLRKLLNYYMAAYHILKPPKAKILSEMQKGFENTPETIARFLIACPFNEPLAADPEVRVVCEDVNGQVFPVTGIWYDKERGMVRLETEIELNETISK